MDDEQRQHLRNLRRDHQRRLHILERQAATFGIATPPEIQTEIEDIQSAIAQIDVDLGQARPTPIQASPATRLPISPVDRLVVAEDTARQAEYICYLSTERLASLYLQVDAETLADPRYLHRQGVLLSLGESAGAADMERRRKAATAQLAIVLDYLEKNAQIGDLAAIISTRGQLNYEWYFVEAQFRSGPWEPAAPNVFLRGSIEDFELLLSCSKANFTGLHKEGDIYTTDSVNYFFFEGTVELPLHGLVRLAAVDQHERILRGSALYLVLNTDLGSLQDVAGSD